MLGNVNAGKSTCTQDRLKFLYLSQLRSFSNVTSTRTRARRRYHLAATPQLTAQVAHELARRTAAHAAFPGGKLFGILNLSKASLTSVLLGYIASLALVASIGAWAVYLTGLVYRQLEPPVPVKEEKRLYGVDVTYSSFCSLPQVLKAADFAARAHEGQWRLTGQPYVTHVLQTALIVEGQLANSARSFTLGERAEMAVVVALLHDVLDDTKVSYQEVEADFGPEVAKMVEKVSSLSSLNQLLRRNKRQRLESKLQEDVDKGAEEEKGLLQRMMLEMVHEPLVIVVKLADRLHNMRTAYALAPNKRRAVATETLEVWCTLAERLGMFAIKSELEDLCFAILHPECYRKLHAERDSLWQINVVSPSVADDTDKLLGSTDPPSAAAAAAEEHHRGPETACHGTPSTSYSTESTTSGSRRPRRILSKHDLSELSTHDTPATSLSGLGVLPKRAGLQETARHKQTRQLQSRIEVPQPFRYWRRGGDSAAATSSKKGRKRQLDEEQQAMQVLLRTVLRFNHTTTKLGEATMGSTIDLAGLKQCSSLLIYEMGIECLATGLNVHVEGRLKSLHSVWKKMQRKNSSLAEVYDARALRIVVDDEGGSKQQVAIQTCYSLLSLVQRLWRKVKDEDDDDYIANPKPSGYQSLHTAVLGPGGAPLEVQIRTSTMHEVAEYGQAAHWTYKENTPPLPGPTEPGVLRRGQPVMRVCENKLSLGAVVEWDRDTRRTLVVIRTGTPSDASPVSQLQVDALLKEVEDAGWCRPGDGDFYHYLEEYAFYYDHKFHKIDAYNARGKATIVPLPVAVEVTELEEKEEGSSEGQSQAKKQAAKQMDQKIRLMREMLEWGGDMEASRGSMDSEESKPSVSQVLEALKDESGSTEIMIYVFPEATMKIVPSGTTAATIIHEEGSVQLEPRGPGERVVNVNNLLVPESTQLKNGDFVVRSRELLKI